MDTAQWPQELVVKPLEDTVRDQNQKQELKCPRCNSSNTKFCYYNNYSLTQPRYLCKACKRYWTLGGSLRNIPVGGASRKIHKRSSSSSSSASYYNNKNNVMNKLPDLVAPQALSTKAHEAQDLNRFISDLDPPQTHISSSPLELLTRGFTSFMPASTQDISSYTSGLSFLLDGIGSGSYGSGRLLFPFEDLKQAPSTASDGDREQGADHISTGGYYWPW